MLTAVVVVELDLRVAADPEQARALDLHPGEELLGVRARSPGRGRRRRAPPSSTPARTRSHCGSSLGTLTRTSTDSPLTGSSSRNAHEVERFETNGNGCAASRLSGVSTGEISRVEDAPTPPPRCASVSSSQPTRWIPCSASRGRSTSAVAGRLLRRASTTIISRIAQQLLAALLRGEARVVRRRPDQRHPLHEELVQVRREDREELHALEQRRPLVERLLQHAPVELEPAHVAVDPGRRPSSPAVATEGVDGSVTLMERRVVAPTWRCTCLSNRVHSVVELGYRSGNDPATRREGRQETLVKGATCEVVSRCDLHVHSIYSTDSGNYALRRARLGESYTEPERVYRDVQGARHDARHDQRPQHASRARCGSRTSPDTFLSVEVTTRFPEDDVPLHVLVWNLTEEDHRDLQPYRPSVYELVALPPRARPRARARAPAVPDGAAADGLARRADDAAVRRLGGTERRPAARVERARVPARGRGRRRRSSRRSPSGTGSSRRTAGGSRSPAARTTTARSTSRRRGRKRRAATRRRVPRRVARGEGSVGGAHGSTTKLAHAVAALFVNAYRAAGAELPDTIRAQVELLFDDDADDAEERHREIAELASRARAPARRARPLGRRRARRASRRGPPARRARVRRRAAAARISPPRTTTRAARERARRDRGGLLRRRAPRRASRARSSSPTRSPR